MNKKPLYLFAATLSVETGTNGLLVAMQLPQTFYCVLLCWHLHLLLSTIINQIIAKHLLSATHNYK
jgi:hypothetical protein